MTIYLNHQPLRLERDYTLSEWFTAQDIPCDGTAVAINNRVIRRDQWSVTPLQEGDQVMLIRASHGG